MRRIVCISLVASALLASGCSSQSRELNKAGNSGKPQVVQTTLKDVGLLDKSMLDTKTNPCNDFYQFACGGLIDQLEIPADKSAIGPWDQLNDRNEAELKRILEEAMHAASPDALARQLGSYYGACMDESAIEANGLKPIEGLLSSARSIKDVASLEAAIVTLHRHKVWALWEVGAIQDANDATRIIAGLDQNGLGLPDRDYYLNDDDRSKQLREAYVAHVQQMLQLSGATDAQARQAAADVMEIETGLARVSKSRVERRDPVGTYNKIDRKGLEKSCPRFPWKDYFKGLGHPDVQDISVTAVGYFEGLDVMLGTIRPTAWSSYLQWQIISRMAPSLSRPFVDENFKMEAKFSGRKQLSERWKRCIGSTDAALGEVLAQPFVKARFGDEGKKQSEEMIRQISRAMNSSLDKLQWMDDKTRAEAHAKLDALVYHIGYPNKWRSYTFEIDPHNHVANVLASRAFEFQYDLDKIGKPVDRESWDMTPPTVNAYYNPNKNEMMFPAGILQPPMFNLKANTAVNLGGMGMIMGHELTHGFDDEGSQYAGDGNLRNWWAPAVSEKYKEKTQCLVNEYNQFEPLPGIKLKGELTLGENIADNSGLKLAFDAYRNMRKDAPERTVADGFTEDQQFFLSFAQIWCMKAREERIRLLAQVDVHSPPRFRINGVVSNMSEFSDAFQCSEGTPMHPRNRCTVW